MTSSINITRKKLLWRAKHRGTQELDILLGRFAEKHLVNMDIQTLKQFENFMELAEPKLMRIFQREEHLPKDTPYPLKTMLELYLS